MPHLSLLDEEAVLCLLSLWDVYTFPLSLVPIPFSFIPCHPYHCILAHSSTDLVLNITPERPFADAFCQTQKPATSTFLPCSIKDLSVKTSVWVWFMPNLGSRRKLHSLWSPSTMTNSAYKRKNLIGFSCIFRELF